MKGVLEIKRNLKVLKEGARLAGRFFSIRKVRDAVPVNNYTLLAVDSILPKIVMHSPIFAGWSAVIATHSDLIAEGGNPSFFLLSLSAPDTKTLIKLMNGVKHGTKLVGVKIVGGHTILSAPAGITGIMSGVNVRKKKKTLKSGYRIGVIIRLKGKKGISLFPSWNCFHKTPPSKVKEMREAMLFLHKNSLISYAKDISSGGILGTSAITLESERLGGHIVLDSIPKPPHISTIYWLSAFHSFGFVVFYKKENKDIIKKMCNKVDLMFAEIGEVNKSRKLTLIMDGNTLTFFDFSKEAILR